MRRLVNSLLHQTYLESWDFSIALAQGRFDSAVRRARTARPSDIPSDRRRRLRRALIGTTALIALALAGTLAGAPTATPALADGGNGASSSGFNCGTSGSGGADSSTETGGAGGDGYGGACGGAGGGGGGAGQSGGQGGHGGGGFLGGAAGAGGTVNIAGGNGGAGGNGSSADVGGYAGSGGGGGGGAHGYVGTDLPLLGAGNGGNGGYGGHGADCSEGSFVCGTGGGGGGAGGYGYVVTGSNLSSNDYTIVVQGGYGGDGGNADKHSYANTAGAIGGTGGHGIVFTGSDLKVSIGGPGITGGSGGGGGGYGFAGGNGGTGGSGIVIPQGDTTTLTIRGFIDGGGGGGGGQGGGQGFGGAYGGTGGDGGDGVSFGSGAQGSLIIQDDAVIYGGNGGAGGYLYGAGNGGNGGDGGNGGNGVLFSGGGRVTNQSSTITGPAGTITGGAGGAGGNFGCCREASGTGSGGNGGHGGAGVYIGGQGDVTNTGAITGGAGGRGGKAYVVSSSAAKPVLIVGGNGGTGAAGVSFSDQGTLKNYGTIQGGDGGAGGDGQGALDNRGGNAGAGGYGVSLGSDGTVINYASGAIQGGNGGFRGTGDTDGGGAAGGFGVSLGSGGMLTNSGSISGGYAQYGNGGIGVSAIAGSTTIINTGQISGGLQSSGLQSGYFGGIGVALDGNLTNSGTISGGGYAGPARGATGGVGVTITGKLTNSAQGMISGGESYNGGAGVEAGADSTIYNYGKIFGGTAEGGRGGVGVSLQSGKLTNDGQIWGGDVHAFYGAQGIAGAGVYLNGGKVGNYGRINGGNSATAASGGDGIEAAAGVVNNYSTGQIYGATGGVYGNTGASGGNGVNFTGAQGSLTNSGRITGGDAGFKAYVSGGNGGFGVVAVASGANVSITNTESGMIAGGVAGAGTGEEFGGIGVAVAGDLNNYGRIYGGHSNGGTGGAGVTIQNGTLTNNGTISAGNGTAGSTEGTGGVGVWNAANVTIINNGTISGGFDGNGAGTQQAAITFSSGTNLLELWSDSTIKGNVSANGADDTLAWGGDEDGTFDVSTIGAQYQGFESFEKSGTSTWTLTGTSTYTEATTVVAGTLLVNGSIASSSSLTVNTGGIVGGVGTLPTTTINSGGALSPGEGNSIDSNDPLTVDGDLTFESGSTYHVQTSSTGGPSYTDLIADTTSVTGTATIGDNVTVTVDALSANYGTPTPLTILTADSVTGTFDSVSTERTFLVGTLTYPDDDEVQLTLTLESFTSAALTRNHRAIARALDAQGVTSDLGAAVFGSETDEAARQAFDLLSGEFHASIKSALIEDSRFVREAATNRLRASFGDITAAPMQVLAYGAGGSLTAPATTPSFAAWGQAFGSWGHIDGDGNAARLDRSIGGFFLGADALVAESWRLGLLGGYSRSSFNVDKRGSSGDSDNYNLAVYGGTQWGGLGLRLGAAYTWHDIGTHRSVAFPGFEDRLKSSYDAATVQGFGELGYRFDTGFAAIEPFGGLAYVNLDTDGFRERGDAAALTGNGGSMDTTFTTLGLRASRAFLLGDTQATARGMLGWRHAFGDVKPTQTLGFAGGDAFTVAGVPIARDAAVIEAGLDVSPTANMSIGIAYSGQIAADALDQGVKGTLTWNF